MAYFRPNQNCPVTFMLLGRIASLGRCVLLPPMYGHVVCVRVAHGNTTVSPAKTAEPIEMPLEM